MKKLLLLLFLALPPFLGLSQSSKATAPIKRDTLFAKRTFLWTKVYKNSFVVSNSDLKNAMNIDSHARVKYAWGKILQPVAPVLVIGGVALMVNGLTGVQKSIVVDGVNYDYQDRSLTKTLLGLATTTLGICLIESSNELIQHSVDIYNDAVLNRKSKVSYKIGVTPEGNIGLAMKF